MKTLPDIIDFNLNILFIGFNPGLRSAETGHHYAGYSNRFWKLLHQSGITERQLRPDEDARLLEYGCGSTNIVARPTRSAAEIAAWEFKEGAEALKKLVSYYKPKAACYMGIGVYRVLTGNRHIKCGLQPDSIVEGVMDYVCSSPSGLNRIPYEEQLECLVKLKKLVEYTAAR